MMESSSDADRLTHGSHLRHFLPRHRDARPDAKAYCVHCLFLASECSNILLLLLPPPPHLRQKGAPGSGLAGPTRCRSTAIFVAATALTQRHEARERVHRCLNRFRSSGAAKSRSVRECTCPNSRGGRTGSNGGSGGAIGGDRAAEGGRESATDRSRGSPSHRGQHGGHGGGGEAWRARAAAA